MKITGAVLEDCHRPGPWAETKPIVVCELDLDDPGPQEVLVQIEAAGVCHSDLSAVNGARPRGVPQLLGHEACGRVAAVGDEVTEIGPGDRVVLVFNPRCGQCEGCRSASGLLPCRLAGEANAAGTLLHGYRRLSRNGVPVNHHTGVSGFASAAVVHHSSVVRIDDDIPADVAALLGCAVLTGGGAVLNAAKLAPGEDVIVVGAGGVGLAAVLVARALDAGRITVVDMNQSKFATARKLGADDAMSPDELAERAIKAPCVIEATGVPAALEGAIAATSAGGRTVTVGLAKPGSQATFLPLPLVFESRSIIGSYLGSGVPAQDVPKYVKLWRAGKLPIELLISAHITLEQVNHAMDQLQAGTALRQIIKF